jgi:4-amino-4-deoxy-L-arabinose transferase-like glycosyltransferase
VAIQAVRVARWGEIAGLVAGGLAPVAVVVAWLIATGAWDAALDAILGYAAAYRAANADLGARLSAPVVTWTLLSYLYLIVPAALGAVRAVRDPGARRQAVVIGLAWVILSLVLVALQGRFFAHYAIPLALPLGLLAGMGFQRLGVLLSRARRPLVRAGLLAPFLAALLISVAAALAGGRMEWLPVWRDHERSERVAEAIRASTGPDDAIWVWGNEPQLYLGAQRSVATAFSYLYPLVTPGYTTPTMIQATLADLEADPPALVIDAGSRAPGVVGFQQLLIPRPLTSDGRDLDILDPLRDFVGERYDEAATVDGWVIYALRVATP